MKLAPAGPGTVTACEASHGLIRRPFGVTADPRFTYASRSHSSAFEEVTDALRRGEGLIVVTGGTGTGKTMLCRALLQSFDRRTFLSIVLDPRLTVNDLFQHLLVDFGLVTRSEPSGTRSGVDRHQFVSALQRFLSGLTPVGGQAVIVIDEAQHLDPDVLEEIRLLSNFERGDARLLQIVLVGQPDLDTALRRPHMRQVAQRIARRIELHPLSADEVPEYIERRLLVASAGDGRADFGANPVRFSSAAVRAIVRISGGIPRVINALCDRALENAFDRQADAVDRAAVMTAARQLKLRAGFLPNLPDAARVGLAACACVVCAAAAALWSSTTPSAPPTAPLRATAPVARTMAADPIATAGSPSDAPDPAATAGAGPTDPAGPPTLRLTAPATDNTGAFEIAVAAFRTAQRAEEVADAIAQTGLPTSTRSDPAGWHQIVVGPLGSADAAESVQKELAREGFPNATISVSRPERR